MTLAQSINWATLTLCTILAISRGGMPERLGILMIGFAFLVTPFVQRLDSWSSPQYGIMSVDIGLTLALSGLAFLYNRYWPLWAAAFQAVAVLCDLVFLVNPGALYRAFYVANFSIGYLVLGSIVGGVIMESRAPPRLRFPAH